ncbi:hypothetical protein [Corynebacterium accolens]|uniref:hypothetical protein n=1 Tax=Corynebacterium accolens TaxID=38284 RepID=UPI0003B8C9D5|nr:hypothetical protein [Corynebacterium accolens]ERS52076.1 hypothetical protein HMPREF1267_01850 [Corynebacterium sp. KPL1824]WKS58129.1 Rha family transcriptional regulator [Corynebacterium accolens]
MNNQLVHANTDGTLATTSEVISDGVGIQHKNVLETIRKNQADFEVGLPANRGHVVKPLRG